MNYYIQAFKRYADFTGRSRRSEYWYFVLFNILAFIVTMIIDAIIQFPVFTMLYMLGTLIPAISLVVRRLHDVGKSGWWYFIGLIPLVGGIILLVFLVTDSQPGNNQWGPNPKDLYAGSDIADHLVS